MKKDIKIFDEERDFVPHMTLIKLPYKNDSVTMNVPESCKFPALGVGKLSLFAMQRDEDGLYLNKFTVEI